MLQAMRHEWQAWSTMARLTVYWRAHMGKDPLSWLCLTMALAAPVPTIALSGRWDYGIGMGAGVPLLVLAVFWWAMLLYAMLIQNHATGTLLPRLRVRTVGVILLTGLTWTLGLTALFSLAGCAPLATFAALASLFAAMALFVVWPALPIGMVILLFAALLLDVRALRYLVHETPPETWTLAAALLTPLLLFLALSGLFRIADRPGMSVLRDPRLQVKRLDHLFHFGAGSRLRRAIGSASAGDLLLHGLGPRMKLPLLITLAPVALFGIALVALAPDAPASLRLMLQAGMVMLSPWALYVIPPSVPLAIARSRDEQALLRLCGRAPAAGLLNTVLAGALVREFLRMWAVWTVAMLMFAWAGGVSAERLLCLLPAISLPLLHGSVMLRDYASAAALKSGTSSALFMLACLLGSMLLGLLAVDGKLSIPFSLATGTLGLIGAAVHLRVRWLAMVRARPALPAGRID